MHLWEGAAAVDAVVPGVHCSFRLAFGRGRHPGTAAAEFRRYEGPFSGKDCCCRDEQMPAIRCCPAVARCPSRVWKTHLRYKFACAKHCTPYSDLSMCTGGEGTFADDLEVRTSLAAAQLGRKGQPEPHALVGMHASEGAGPSLWLRTLRSSASLLILQTNNDVQHQCVQ